LLCLSGCIQSAEQVIQHAETSAYETHSLDEYFVHSYCEKQCQSRIEDETGYTFEDAKRLVEIEFNRGSLGKEFDSFEILSVEDLDQDEKYIEYRINFADAEPRDDFAYMIKVGGKWKIHVERELFGSQ